MNGNEAIEIDELPDEVQNLISDQREEGFDEGRADLTEWMKDTIDEWHGMKIVNDNQMIALLRLSHELDRQAWR